VSAGLYILRDQTACATRERREQAGFDLLRLALAHRFTSDPDEWQLARAATGARFVTHGPIEAARVSLSHTGDTMVAAVTADESIGVDLERPQPRRYAAIANHLNWPPSQWAEEGQPTQDEFLHLWTLWEALYKSESDAAYAVIRGVFAGQLNAIRAGTTGGVSGTEWSGQSWRSHHGEWLSFVTPSARIPAISLFQVDTLVDDMDSAQIQTITAREGEIHF
jgi:hypothetical protein